MRRPLPFCFPACDPAPVPVFILSSLPFRSPCPTTEAGSWAGAVRIGPCTPAHDPASAVGHGGRKGREERVKTGTGAGSQAGKQKRQGPTRTGLRYVLTLAFKAFGLCHVIQFPLRFRNVLRLRAALPQHSGPSWGASPYCLRVFAESPVGKKSRTEGGPRYFRQRRKLQPAGGEGARNPAGAGLGFRAPKRPPVFSAISAAEAICFCSFPPQSCGCGNGGTGSGGCRDP